MISALDLFRIGIGPSSSHTVGPIRIVRDFLIRLPDEDFAQIARVKIELLGSLALTGEGHGTPDACIMGLIGHQPEEIDAARAHAEVAEVKARGEVLLLGRHPIAFDRSSDLVLNGDLIPAIHPNGIVIDARDAQARSIARAEYYSTGGGFFATRQQLERPSEDDMIAAGRDVPFPFASAEDLLARCAREGLGIAELVMANEGAYRPAADTEAGLDRIAQTMMDCIERGLAQEGHLPGDLKVRRRASSIHRQLVAKGGSNEPECLMDWLNLYAMAVNEENAAGGKVVTAPTNGAAGIIPSVMRHYCSDDDGRPIAAKSRRFLLTAAGIGLLYKQRASISGAEMGCQGEVGVACSMAAGGLASVWGGSPEQVCAAAEIGMEHNLGLTCDPVGGLVQIPCIERNAIASVKAVNAARLALHADETPRVSLDAVIETMRQTGLDMSSKYKETSLGGLAANVVAC